MAACSRRRAELEKSENRIVTLHCTRTGDYEPLQCDNGLCWCAQPQTGQPTVGPVHEADMRRLPCCELLHYTFFLTYFIAQLDKEVQRLHDYHLGKRSCVRQTNKSTSRFHFTNPYFSLFHFISLKIIVLFSFHLYSLL